MNHSILDQHDVIAWDVDGTLVSGHVFAPNGPAYIEYIRANPQKKHFIVTFRDRAWAMQVWKELRDAGMPDAKDLIAAVHSCPEPIHDSYMIKHRHPVEVRDDYCRRMGLAPRQFDGYAYAFTRWKAERSKQIGATVLVDDMPQWVTDGCDEHGVLFHHAHTLWA